MDFRAYDRKFWLVIEQDDKKIKDLRLPINRNAFLCYSYYTPNGKNYIEESLIFEALFEAVYINGEYTITQHDLLNLTINMYTKAQLEGYKIIPIDNKAINVAFDWFIESVNNEFYSDDIVTTRDIRYIDEFRREDNPDILKGLLTDMKTFENVWIKIEKLEKIINEDTYMFSCEILSEPFNIKGIHKGDKTLAFALKQNDAKICVCTIGVSEIEDIRKSLKLIKNKGI